MALNHEFTTIVGDTTAVTGSITKILNLSSTVIDEITFGTYGGHGTTSTTTGSSGGLMWKGVQQYNVGITMDTSFGKGRSLEGPIISFKLTSGRALVYHNGTLI